MTLGPGLDAPLSILGTEYLGPGVDAPLSILDSEFLGPGIDAPVDYLDGEFLGPGVDAPVVFTDFGSASPVKLLRSERLAQSPNARVSELAEGEIAAIARLERGTSGSADLWTDNNVTDIKIGGGSNQGLISIGNSGNSILLNGFSAMTITQLLISNAGTLDVGSSSAPNVASLGGRGVTFPVNGLADLVTDVTVLPPSFVAAINELLDRPAVAVENDFTNDNAGTLVVGTAVYVSGEDAVDEADASTDAVAADLAGLMQESTLTSATGAVATSGRKLGKFAPGEGVGPHANARVFLSATAGFLTLTAPSTSGNVVLLVGYVADDTGYDNGAGGTMTIQLIRGQKRVVA